MSVIGRARLDIFAVGGYAVIYTLVVIGWMGHAVIGNMAIGEFPSQRDCVKAAKPIVEFSNRNAEQQVYVECLPKELASH